MDLNELKPIIEAMIFVADEPLTEGAIVAALADAGIGRQEVRNCILAIEQKWNLDASRGINLVHVGGGYQFRTKPAHAEWLKRLNIPKPMRLSAPALETMAIVAYRQPIVRSEIEGIRGVDSGAVLKTLLERRLLRIVGRRDEPGQPLLYGTTKEFLEIFNLNTLSELPTLKDIEELMRERRTLTESSEASMQAQTNDDEEELTESIDIDEEVTDVFPSKRNVNNEEENPEDEKDMEALSDLEQSLKDLRRLERSMFPKPIGEDDPFHGGNGDVGEISLQAKEAASSPPEGAEGILRVSGTTVDGNSADASGSDDCPFK